MKRLFLASSIDITAKAIAKHFKRPVKDLKTFFIPTAAEVEKDDLTWLKNDRQGLVDAGFNLFDYTLTGKKPSEIESDLKGADVIHVNGGNTFYLLLQARKCGFDKFIKKAVSRGVVYIGSSAGSMVASPDIEISKTIEEKTYQKELKNFKAFDLVDFITLPHWGSQDFKDLYFSQRIKNIYKPENKIILLNDYQYIRVEDEAIRFEEIKM